MRGGGGVFGLVGSGVEWRERPKGPQQQFKTQRNNQQPEHGAVLRWRRALTHHRLHPNQRKHTCTHAAHTAQTLDTTPHHPCRTIQAVQVGVVRAHKHIDTRVVNGHSTLDLAHDAAGPQGGASGGVEGKPVAPQGCRETYRGRTIHTRTHDTHTIHTRATHNSIQSAPGTC